MGQTLDEFYAEPGFTNYKITLAKAINCQPPKCNLQVQATGGCSSSRRMLGSNHRQLAASSEATNNAVFDLNSASSADISAVETKATSVASSAASFAAAAGIDSSLVSNVKNEGKRERVQVAMVVAPPPPSAPPGFPPGGPGQFLRERAFGKTWGDPHLSFANGGSADFRGIDQHIFNFVSAPNFTVNVLTVATDFVRWGGQVVHGSFITKLFVKLRSPRTGAIVRVEVRADQFSSFRTFVADEATKYENHTRTQVDGLEALQLSGGRFVAHGAGWEVFVNRRRLRKPLVKGSNKDVAPQGDSSRWFLDISFNVLDNRKGDSEKFGRSTLGRTAPHGIVGQSFDGSLIAVSGKQDKYGDAPEYTTTAQAEGAIEGVFTEYIMPSPFDTNFKYSRFDSKGTVAPRNVTTLSGTKTAAKAGSSFSAGSTELYGVEE